MSENFDAVNVTLDTVLAESLKLKLAVAALATDVLALRADAARSDNQTAINALQSKAQAVLDSLIGIEAAAVASEAPAVVADPAPAPVVDAPAPAVVDVPVVDAAPAVEAPAAAADASAPAAGTSVEGALS